MPTPTKKAPVKKAGGTGGGPGSRGPTRVNYAVTPVNEMAEPIHGTGGNRARYVKLMQPLLEHPGQLFLLAEYQAEQGATRVKSQIVNGKTEVPEGPDAWELTAIKTNVADGEGGTTVGSHLYARYIGDGGGGADSE